ncbi:phosphotransferase family protein [Brevibacillus sp. NRS-1366]|uniref:phosphotransferase family protein n=1 Tax=Brevibacillus sp. NRS-1366 TaxID=3233899 RepID=UPI003D1F294C
MLDWLEQLQKEVRSLQNAVRIEKILKGFSTDEKYRIDMVNGEKRLLRVSSLEQREQKKAEFEILQTIESYGVNASLPIEFGVWEDRGLCFMVLSYLEGEDARDMLPGLPQNLQFDIGYRAGQDLAKMHQLEAPSIITPWFDRCVQKHRRYIEAYHASKHRIPHADSIIAFIEEHLDYVKSRPNRFLHDDFHVGNLIVHDQQYAGVIDFNRYDWGDPFHEFTKLAFFSKEISVPFSHGQLSGYFGRNKEPDTFWILYGIYTGMAIFSSIVWTGRVVPDLLIDMLKRVERIIEEHKAFEQLIPDWFCPGESV